MSGSPVLLLSRADERALHQRLAAGDPVASAELAETYLPALMTWLEQHNRQVDPALCGDAADRALLSLIDRPGAYDPQRQSLEVYLRMSAQGDLMNLLRRQWTRTQHEVPWSAVELSPQRGKYLRRDDDPAQPLEIRELMERAVPAAVREGLTEVETRVLELLLQKERRTAEYARVCGLDHLPAEEQAREVKRLKDRLKQRLKRSRHRP